MPRRRYSFWSTVFHIDGSLMLLVAIMLPVARWLGIYAGSRDYRDALITGVVGILLLGVGWLLRTRGWLPRYTVLWFVVAVAFIPIFWKGVYLSAWLLRLLTGILPE